YPNFQGSLPIAGEVLPNWFAEGIAQYQCPSSRNDIWESHRDMLLRTAVLEGDLLTFDEMGGLFGKDSREAELVYNQGYSLVRYISDTYGPDRLKELLSSHKVWHRIGFNGACKDVLGFGSGELYSRWKEHLAGKYEEKKRLVSEKMVAGSEIAGKGYMNMQPVPSKDGGGIYYLSNRGRDYMSTDLVYEANDGAGRQVEISGRIASRPAVSPDGSRIAFAKRTGDNDYGYELNDIFLYDTKTGRTERLTRGGRLVDPAWSPEGSMIAAVRTGDGAEDIVIVSAAGGEVRVLAEGGKGTRFYGLSWGRHGLLTSHFDGTSRDIALIDTDDGSMRLLASSLSDERDPAWDTSGEGFFFSSDRTGIFNVYHSGIDGDDVLMVTNVIGGAFNPVEAGGDLLFSSYDREGYRIRSVTAWRAEAMPGESVEADLALQERRREHIIGCGSPDRTGAAFDYAPLDGKMIQASDCGIKYTPVYFFPRLMYYDKKPRIGLTLDSRDYLDRQSFFAAGSINDDKEFNYQFGLQTRQFKPTFDLSFYFARKYYRYFEEAPGNVQVRYDLWDVFFNCRLEFDKPERDHVKEIVLQYNHGEYGLNINAWEAEDIDMEMGWKYYRANEVSAIFNYLDVKPGVDSDINPRGGRKIALEVTRAWDDLSSGAFEYNFKPIYDDNEFGRYTLRYEEYIPLPFWSHSLTLYIRAGMVDKEQIDDFFNLFLGSREGLRGYSYYSIGGKRNLMARGTWRFPIWRNINRQLMTTYVGSIYGAFFVEAGKAWDDDGFDLDHNQKDAGFELRLKGITFFNYPLAASVEGAYGFDEVIFRDPFVEGIETREGREWKFYGTVFFDF
ncbi:MAG TPA: hypothetical protein VLA34_02630, partial [Candidatus Krumholzibacterium sp.]|nr:hypothetical protein [Candidatus Krumholzibacterium sp.]